jgi:hypothetical protein
MGGYDAAVPIFTSQLTWDYPSPVAAGSLIPQPGQQFPPYDVLLSFGGNGSNLLPIGAANNVFWWLPVTLGGQALNGTAFEWDVPTGTYTSAELDLFIRILTVQGVGASVTASLSKNSEASGLSIGPLTDQTSTRQYQKTQVTFVSAGSTHDRVGMFLLSSATVSGDSAITAGARIRLFQSPSIAPASNTGPTIGRASMRQRFAVTWAQAVPVGAGTVMLSLYVNGVLSTIIGTYTNPTVGAQAVVETFSSIGATDRWTILVTTTSPGFDLQFDVCAMFFPD